MHTFIKSFLFILVAILFICSLIIIVGGLACCAVGLLGRIGLVVLGAAVCALAITLGIRILDWE